MLKTLRWLLLTFVFVSPALGRDPADPAAGVPPARYNPIISGTKSFRPVEPLPWGDVNRRVTPQDIQPSPSPGEGKVAPKPQTGPHGQH